MTSSLTLPPQGSFEGSNELYIRYKSLRGLHVESCSTEK